MMYPIEYCMIRDRNINNQNLYSPIYNTDRNYLSVRYSFLIVLIMKKSYTFTWIGIVICLLGLSPVSYAQAIEITDSAPFFENFNEML